MSYLAETIVTLSDEELALVTKTKNSSNENILRVIESTGSCSLELYKEFVELFKLRQMTPLESRVNQILNNKFYDSQFVDKFTLFTETPYPDDVTSIRFVYSDRTVQLDRINRDDFILTGNTTFQNKGEIEISSTQQLVSRNTNFPTFGYVKEYNCYSQSIDNLRVIDGFHIGKFENIFNGKLIDLTNAKDGLTHDFNSSFVFDVFIHDVENSKTYKGEWDETQFTFPDLTSELSNQSVLYVGLFKGDEEVHFIGDMPLIESYAVQDKTDGKNVVTMSGNTYLQFVNVARNDVVNVELDDETPTQVNVDIGDLVNYKNSFYFAIDVINQELTDSEFNDLLETHFTRHLELEKVMSPYINRNGVVTNLHPMKSSMFYVLIDNPTAEDIGTDSTMFTVIAGKPLSMSFQGI